VSARLAPSLLLSGAVALGLVVAALVLAAATQQRWLGLTLSAQPDLDLVWIDSADARGPAAGVPVPGVLVALVGPDGTRIAITPQDLVEEPDTLPDYTIMRAFLARQGEIAALLDQGSARVEIEVDQERRPFDLRPAAQRPLRDLPAPFWMQLAVGLAGFWIGAWVWALRPGEWATRFLALAGAGLMISALAAAVYSTRELALPEGLFRLLSRLNQIGALSFGVGMIGLFLIYPRRLVASRWLVAPALVLGTWAGLEMAGVWPDPGIGRHLPVLLAMLAIVALIALQYRATRGDPRDRAALTWLGLAVIVGAGAFVTTVIAPVVLGIDPVLAQAEAFLFFLLIYVGVALGVARFRLFDLGDWAFRVLFYVAGVVLLLVIDAILILTLVDERAPAFALSLLIVALAWLPLRDTLARLTLGRVEPARGRLFRQVIDVALSPEGEEQLDRWRALLGEVFRPLSITPCAPSAAPKLIDDGLAMVLPPLGALPGLRLDHANGGRALFSQRDVELAGDLGDMLAHALESRAAYEKGVAEERWRIARDIHDNIGVQLMGALHSHDAARKDMMIRETLTDLRDIVNNSSRADLSFDELLADLRSQIGEPLFAAGVQMTWTTEAVESGLLPLPAVHTLRSVLREAVQNALRHGKARAIAIEVRLHEGRLRLSVQDDGIGFDAVAVVPGNGLANMQARVSSLGGEFHVRSGAGGTRIEAHFPVNRQARAR